MNDIKEFLLPEERCGFKVTEKRKKIWQIELECFEVLKKICKLHNLKYYLIDGTLLGAIRHKGFIPWDDDMDVVMPREDYDAFLKYADAEITDGYSLQTSDGRDEFRCGFSRIRKDNTTALLKGQWSPRTKMHCGIFIDIFPLDCCPDDPKKRAIHRIVGRFLCVASNSLMFDLGNKPHGLREITYNIIRRVLRIIPADTVVRQRDKWMTKYNNKGQKQFGAITIVYNSTREIWDIKDFGNGKEVPFENTTAIVPDNPEKILGITFGDWKTPVQGGSMHEGTLFDPDKPYTYYIERYDEYKDCTTEY